VEAELLTLSLLSEGGSMRLFRFICPIVLAVFVVLTVAATAQATSILTANALTTQDTLFSNTAVTGSAYVTATYNTTGACCGGFSWPESLSFTAKATYGALHAQSSVLSAFDIAAWSTWTDTITATGGNPGDRLDYLVKVNVDGTLSAPPGTRDPGVQNINIFSEVGSYLSGLPGGGACPNSGAFWGAPRTNCNASYSDGVESDENGHVWSSFETRSGSPFSSFVVQLISGQTYNVEQTLSVRSAVYGLIFDAPTSADYSDTAVFELDPITTGAGYTTGSGTDYRSVPEPASILLLAFGLAFLYCRQRSHRQAEGSGARSRS
jgi:hypothetical protein